MLSIATSMKRRIFLFGIIAGTFVGSQALAAASSDGHGSAFAMTILWIALLLILAKVGGLVEKIGQPSVLGELVIGVIIGNLGLIGLHFVDVIKHDIIIEFLAELGVIVLLFQIGLESNISEMRKNGLRAVSVALVGVIVPFVLGAYVIGPWLLPGLTMNAYLFLGAAMTATSVGITARVFQELGKLKMKEAQIVLGAAVIDDVLGLIILAVVTALATVGAISFGAISWIAAKAIIFLVGAVIIGQLIAPYLGRLFSKIHAGIGMKFTLAICFGLVFAFLAQEFGLAAIVGAFAAGLILDPVHFRYFKDPHVIADLKKHLNGVEGEKREEIEKTIEKHSHRHIEDIIEPLAHFLVPIFFVFTGMAVNLETLKDPRVVIVSLVVSVVAIFGKWIAGYFAGKGVNRSLIGFGMVPRGEVGLIFAAIGLGVGVVSEEVFSIIVIMVILTTLVTPPIIAKMLKKAA